MPHQIAAIARGGVDVVARIEFVGEGIQGVVERAAIEARKIARHRHVRDAADGEADAVARRHRRAGDDGEIAVAARDFAKRAALADRRGNDTASIISSSARAVAIMPVKKSFAGTRRRRLALRRCTSPPSASSTSGNSALGSACAIEPQTVPRLRVWAWPVHGNASAASCRLSAELRPVQQRGLTDAGTDRDRFRRCARSAPVRAAA